MTFDRMEHLSKHKLKVSDCLRCSFVWDPTMLIFKVYSKSITMTSRVLMRDDSFIRYQSAEQIIQMTSIGFS
jgi:hypothetical protein